MRDSRRHWRQYVVIGITNSTLPFMLFAFAALHLPASYSVILNATTPLFTALLAVPLLGERLTAAKIAGLVAGMAGVALVSGAGPVVPDLGFALAVAACLGATLCYAGSSIYMKKHAAGARPLAIAGWSQIFAGLALLPLVPFAPPTGPITPLIVANVLALSLLCSSIAYVLYYRLIADIGPTRALTMAFLMPVFGMLWGALFLSETITRDDDRRLRARRRRRDGRTAAGAGASTPVMMRNARSPRARGRSNRRAGAYCRGPSACSPLSFWPCSPRRSPC